MKAMKVVGVSFSHFRMATNSERNDSIWSLIDGPLQSIVTAVMRLHLVVG
jgi:hypothetical protein